MRDDSATGAPAAVELTSELRAQLLEHIRAGMHVSPTLEALGLDWCVISDWLERDAGGEPGPWAGLRRDIRQARAQHERMLLDALNLSVADPRNARHILTYLQARYPDRWQPGRGDQLRTEAVDRVLEQLRSSLSPGAFLEVVDALTGAPTIAQQGSQPAGGQPH